MNINTSAAGVLGMTKELLRAWDETQVSWRDAKAAEFAQLYLAPVTDAVESLSVVADKLDRVISQVRADCE
jgi:hypothetical protein